MGSLYGPMVVEGQHVFDGFTSDDITRLRGLLQRMTELTDCHRARLED